MRAAAAVAARSWFDRRLICSCVMLIQLSINDMMSIGECDGDDAAWRCWRLSRVGALMAKSKRDGTRRDETRRDEAPLFHSCITLQVRKLGMVHYRLATGNQLNID